MTEANRNLLLRLTSAAVLIPILIALIVWQRPEPWALSIHLAVIIGLVEFYWIVLRDDPVWMRLAGVFLGGVISVIIYWLPSVPALTSVLILAILGSSILHLACFGNIQTVATRMGLMSLGMLYLPVLLTPLALLKRLPHGSDWVFLLLTITWFGDTGAYFAGRMWGRRKLYPAISPGKTYAGAMGGLIASLGAAVLAKLWYLPQLTWLDGILLALPASALAQCGDLVESMLKRSFQVKDSGWIIPGHGGLLDRIDALLFSTPYVYLYATYFFRGS